MEQNKETHGRLIHLISTNGKPEDKKGVIQTMDSEGNYFVKWYDGSTGIVYSRGCVYRLYDIPQNKMLKIKNLFLYLLNKFKTYINYGN
jgi:hypothetical protein